jgi:ribosomal protein S18 acetylase RimI-like enzyme
MARASPPIEIRSGEPSDADAIERVAEVAWRADYPDVLHRENVEDAAREWYDPEAMSDSLTDPRTVGYVACLEGEEVVGFVHAYDDSARERRPADDVEEPAADGYVFRAYVHPEHRGRDVGRDMLAAALEDLAGRGCDRVRATVLEENDAGQAFYEAFGFERVGVTGETEIGGDYYDEVAYVTEPS